MKVAQSKLTAQGQISVPVEVRKRLGLEAGSVIEWNAEGDAIVVRRAGRFSSEDVHRALFESPPQPRTLQELREGVEAEIRRRHARR